MGTQAKLHVTKVGEHYVRLSDGTCWPRPRTDAEHNTRYGDAEKHRYVAASYIAGFDALCRLPQKRRNEICRLLAEAQADAGEGT